MLTMCTITHGDTIHWLDTDQQHSFEKKKKKKTADQMIIIKSGFNVTGKLFSSMWTIII